MAYAKNVVLLSKEGKEVLSVSGFAAPQDIEVTTSNEIWVADTANRRLVKLNDAGKELVSLTNFPVRKMAYHKNTDTLWVLHDTDETMVQISRDGTQLLKVDGFFSPSDLAVCQNDGSVWVADTNHNQLAHVSSAGKELKRVDEFRLPKVLDTYVDEFLHCNIWAFDQNNDQLVLLDSNGFERERLDHYSNVAALSTIKEEVVEIPLTTINLSEEYRPGDIVLVGNASQDVVKVEKIEDAKNWKISNLENEEGMEKNEVVAEQRIDNILENVVDSGKDKMNETGDERYRALLIYGVIAVAFGIFLYTLFSRKKS